MNILAIETSTEACSAALLCAGGIKQQFQVAPRGHGDLILNMVDALLAEADLKPQQLDAIAFGRGPGAFTGVRIATSVTQGLALGLDLPVIPVSTLQAVAQGAYRLYGCEQIVCAMDARMSEVYFAAYQYLDGSLQCVSDEVVCRPDAISFSSSEGVWFGIGTGWGVYGDVLNQHFPSVECKDDRALPEAQDVATLAVGLYAKGQVVSAENALPVYLRDNVVSK